MPFLEKRPAVFTDNVPADVPDYFSMVDGAGVQMVIRRFGQAMREQRRRFCDVFLSGGASSTHVR